MSDRILCSGNEAVGHGAIISGCRHFFAYPITPQNEIAEFMSRELPKIGGVYVQTDGENSAANMIFGGAMTGERVMTATSSPGFSLMQEAISHLALLEGPTVIVEVSRLGPGGGTGGQQGQTDYNAVTGGGGHGGYHNIVIAPYSIQEIFDYTQLAFHLADKYRILVIVMTDFILCRGAEPVEMRPLDLPPLPPKEWGIKGKGKKGGRYDHHFSALVQEESVVDYFLRMEEKYKTIKETEIRYDTMKTEDAELLVIAYGSSARAAKSAITMARNKGIKVGMLRPITLWPFPEVAIREAAVKAGKVLVIEDSGRQMVEDVECAVQGKVPVNFLGLWGRHNKMASGLIYPERVLQEIESLV